jgi:hypothetical protein
LAKKKTKIIEVQPGQTKKIGWSIFYWFLFNEEISIFYYYCYNFNKVIGIQTLVFAVLCNLRSGLTGRGESPVRIKMQQFWRSHKSL